MEWRKCCGLTLTPADMNEVNIAARRLALLGMLALLATGARAADPLTITSPQNLPAATVGVPYAFRMTATGGTAPYYWSFGLGETRQFLQIDSTGLLSGTPRAEDGGQTYQVRIRVRDALDREVTGTFAVTVRLTAPLEIATRSPLADGALGSPYIEAIAATGGQQPYNWSVTGDLPPGLSLGAASGTISGTPRAPGSFTFRVRVADSVGNSASADFSLRITGATLEITSAATLPGARTGEPYRYGFTASGGTGRYTNWAGPDGLPRGLALDAATGQMSGTPAAAGTYTFRVQVTDSSGATAQKTFTLAISQVASPLTITTGSPLPGGTLGAEYAVTLNATGGTAAYAWSLPGGQLPGGLTLDAASGAIRGRPASSGEFSFTVEVTDAAGAKARKQFSLTIAAASTELTITTGTPLPNAVTGSEYRQTITASGGRPPYRWRFPLGEGVGFLSIDAATGVLSGTPPASMAGQTMEFRVMVTDESGQTAIKLFRLLIVGRSASPLRITTESPLAEAYVGLFYYPQILAEGGSLPYRWTVMNEAELPPGLVLDLASGALYGVPAKEGEYRFTVQVRDAAGATGQKVFQLRVTVKEDVIPMGSTPPVAAPVAVASDGGSARVYLLNRRVWDVYQASAGTLPSNAVSVLDTQAGKLAATIFVGRADTGDGQIIGLDPIRRRLYVPNPDENTVSVIDTAKNNVVDSIYAGNRPTAAAVDSATGVVYIANPADNAVSVLDSSGSLRGAVTLDGKPAALAVDPATRKAWVAADAKPWQIVALESTRRGRPLTLTGARGIRSIAIERGVRLYAVDASGLVYRIGIGGADPVLEDSFRGPDPEAPADGLTGVAVDAVAGRLYVTDFNLSKVYSLNRDGRERRSIDVSKGPTGIAIDERGRKAYVSNFLAGGYSIINLDTGGVETSMPVGGVVTGLAFDSARRRLYGSSLTANSVLVIDAEARKPLTAWKTGDFPWTIAADPSVGQVYTVNANDNDLAILSADDGSIRKRIRLPDPQTGAAFLAVNRRTNRLYVTQGNSLGSTLTVIDGRTNAVVKQVKVGERPVGIAVDEDTSRVYVACRNSETIAVVDGTTNEVLETWPMEGVAVWALAIDPDYRQLYVTVPPKSPADFRGLMVLDSQTGKVLKQIRLGSGPELVLVNRPTGHVFVSDPAEGIISRVDGYSLEVEKTLPMGNFAYAMALDEDSWTIYLANGADNTINVIRDSFEQRAGERNGPARSSAYAATKRAK